MPPKGNGTNEMTNPKIMPHDQKLRGSKNAVLWIGTICSMLLFAGYEAYLDAQPTAFGNEPEDRKYEASWSLDMRKPGTAHKAAYGMVALNIANQELLRKMREEYLLKGKPLKEFLDYVRTMKHAYNEIINDVKNCKWILGDDVESYAERIGRLFNELRDSYPLEFRETELCNHLVDNAPIDFSDALRTARGQRSVNDKVGPCH